MKALLELQPRSWALLVMPPRSMGAALLTTIGQLAKLDSICIFDGGNLANPHVIARAVGYRPELLSRVYISRIFTCYQMLAALSDTLSPTPPVVVLDFLRTFYDENVALVERRFTLERCLQRIERLSAQSKLAITVSPPPDTSDARCLFEHTQSVAKRLIIYEVSASPPPQPRLF